MLLSLDGRTEPHEVMYDINRMMNRGCYDEEIILKRKAKFVNDTAKTALIKLVERANKSIIPAE